MELTFGILIASMNPQGDEAMKTGQDVIESGLYVTECCGEEVASKGCNFSSLPSLYEPDEVGESRAT